MLHVLVGALVGAVVGAVGTAVARKIAGKPFDWSSLAAGALGGAATGAIVSLTFGAGLLAGSGLAQAGGMAVAGGAGGFSEQVADNLLHDRDWEQGVVKSTAIGTSLGAAAGAGRIVLRPLTSLIRSPGSLRALAGIRRVGGKALRAPRRAWGRSLDFLKHSPKLTYPRRLWGGYMRALTRHPVRTKSLTAGTIGGAGDLIAQLLEGKEKIDLRRTAFMAAWGAAWAGPVGHFWFRGLERLIPGTAFKYVAGKIALDQFLWSPVNAVLFLGALSLSEGKSPLERIRRDTGRTLKKGWTVWPAIHLITFRYVPENLRVPWGNAVGLGWSVFLSKFIHDSEADSPAEEGTDEATLQDVEGLPLPSPRGAPFSKRSRSSQLPVQQEANGQDALPGPKMQHPLSGNEQGIVQAFADLGS